MEVMNFRTARSSPRPGSGFGSRLTLPVPKLQLYSTRPRPVRLRANILLLTNAHSLQLLCGHSLL